LADAAGAMKTPQPLPDDRLWAVLLWTGAVAGTLFLGLQTFDYFADAGRPALRQNDLFSGLASVAMLVIVGVIAAGRARVRRQAAQAVKPAKGAKRGRRRKGRV